MGVNITTIAYLNVLIIEIGSTVMLMVVEAQGIVSQDEKNRKKLKKPEEKVMKSYCPKYCVAMSMYSLPI